MKSNLGHHVFFRRTVVVGAGYIAVEMAAILHHLGSDVTMLIRKEKVLRTFDQDISDRITKEMEETGIKIMKTTQVTQVEKNSSGLTIKTDAGPSIDAECLLWAVGRTPNVESLGLSKAGVETTQRGHIIVDPYQACQMISSKLKTNVQLLVILISLETYPRTPRKKASTRSAMWQASSN